MAEIVKKKLWPKFLSLFLAIMMITGTVVYGSWAASAPVGVVKIASLATAGEDGIEIDELEGAELNQAIEEVSESENIRAARRFLDKKGVRLSFAEAAAANTSFEVNDETIHTQTVASSFKGKNGDHWVLIHLKMGEKSEVSFSKTTALGGGKYDIKGYKVVEGKVIEADGAIVDRRTGDILYIAADGAKKSFNLSDSQNVKDKNLMQAQSVTTCKKCKEICAFIYYAGLAVSAGTIAAILCVISGFVTPWCAIMVGYVLDYMARRWGTHPSCTNVCTSLKYCP